MILRFVLVNKKTAPDIEVGNCFEFVKQVFLPAGNKGRGRAQFPRDCRAR